jgi:hypothetical protein
MRMDADLAEQSRHPEGARLVRHDRHDELARMRILQQRAEDAHERHRRRQLAFAAVLQLTVERGEGRHRQRRDLAEARRHMAAERRAPDREGAGSRSRGTVFM